MKRTKIARLEISLRVEMVKLVKVKPYTRLRDGKIERVSGYERRVSLS